MARCGILLVGLVLAAPAVFAAQTDASPPMPEAARSAGLGDARLVAYFAHADGTPWLAGDAGEGGRLVLRIDGAPNATRLYTVRVESASPALAFVRRELSLVVDEGGRTDALWFGIQPPAAGTADLRVTLAVESLPVNATGPAQSARLDLATTVSAPPAPPLRWSVVGGSLAGTGALVVALVALMRRLA